MDDNDPDSMLENEYANELPVDDTLPTADNPTTVPKPQPEPEPESEPESEGVIAKDHRSMLKEEETDEFDKGEEKTAIEQKSIYEDKEKKEHFFSKAHLEASSEFEEQMRKRQEFEQERRQRFIATEKKHNGSVSFSQFQELESKNIIKNGKTATPQDELARKLNEQIRENTRADLAEDRDIHGTKQTLLTAIAIECGLFLSYIPNRIFVFPKIMQYSLNIISIMLIVLAFVVITITVNSCKDRHIPARRSKLFVGASILPSAALRIGLAALLAYLLSFIPTAGGYIGFTIGIAIGGTIHYTYLGFHKANVSAITSFIVTAACALILIVPDLTSGVANQPVDPELRLGIAVYFIEILMIMLIDQTMLKIKEWREMK